MRIIFVLTYPSYHTIADRAEWLRWDNRDRRMPGLLAAMGVDVELWGVGREAFETQSDLPGLSPYPIRLFEASRAGAKSRDHVSDAMAEAAREDPADLFVLIGTNGGAGYHLFDKVLRAGRRRFAVIIGGDYWSRIVPHATFLFPESQIQVEALAAPRRLFRKPIPRDRMELLPKTIDTERFRPLADSRKDWDVVAVARLARWKRFDEIGELSATYRIAVAGGGPQAKQLAKRYPAIEWLGHVAHGEVPGLLNRSRLYFHAGRREYHPRAIPEAMACGLPVIAFNDHFGPDVVPRSCGALVDIHSYEAAVSGLLHDPRRRAQMGESARAHVVATHGPTSSEHACRTLMRIAAE
ncbi:glycosyltransferase [Stakelama marina]|uniref:Glycosyltransferase family 4 protein n=1 Tax=Stakelama marina TaxID=2826939 RepID=A0A8T4IJ17_9SPHN|nr:glycosyltransferase [Stakelama marina]MBR0552309.1 glycosyltransferase family 4 protein [Stakelama marina]